MSRTYIDPPTYTLNCKECCGVFSSYDSSARLCNKCSSDLNSYLQAHKKGEINPFALSSGQLVVHRNIEGDHEVLGTSCWCRPVVREADDLRDEWEIIEELNRADG